MLKTVKGRARFAVITAVTVAVVGCFMVSPALGWAMVAGVGIYLILWGVVDIIMTWVFSGEDV